MAVSFWEKQHFYTFDFLVVGAGIVGLSAAYYLQKRFPNRKIAVLEKGFLPHGASTRNAGFACFGSISELIEQERSLGTKGLQQLVEKRWNGLRRLRNLLGDARIDFQQNGGFEIFTDTETQAEKAAFEKILYYNQVLEAVIGSSEIYKPTHDKIGSFGFQNVSGMIENTFEGQLDSGKMMVALWQKTTGEGVLVLNNCQVLSVTEEEKHLLLQTGQGIFRTSQALFCTNAFTPTLLPELDIQPGRGQVLITKPLPDLKLKGTFHHNQGYDYFRNVGSRILLGGGRDKSMEKEETTIFSTTKEITEYLLDLLSRILYTGKKEIIDQQWSGIMAFGKKGDLPLVKEVRPRIFFAGRSSGMGVAMGIELGFEASRLPA